MEKLKLSLESLQVESFATDRAGRQMGTVRGNQQTDFNECGISVQCPTDNNTIDAQVCQSVYAVCGEQTLGATTCRNTGICCGFSVNRTYVCCQQTTTTG